MSTFGDLTPDNTISGGSDGTAIGNNGDRLKVDAEVSLTTPHSISNKLAYDDMNVTNGGVARQTTITASTWVKTYSYSGSGLLHFLNITFETGSDWLVRLIVDGDEIFSSAGISSNDLIGDQIYSLDYSNGKLTSLDSFTVFWGDQDRLQWSPPFYPMKFNSTIDVYVKRVTGAANKKFRAGLIVLNKD